MTTDRVRPVAGEIYFEFQFLPHAVKVSAVDATTGTEVSIMGPRGATQRELESTAKAKLMWVLRKKKAPRPRGDYR